MLFVLAACAQTPTARVGSTAVSVPPINALTAAAAPVPSLEVPTTALTVLPEPILTVPEGFQVSVYAADLGEVRAIAFAPNGTPFVTIMNRGEKFGGKVLALPDADGDGRADQAIVVREGFFAHTVFVS